ncbi:MAG: class I SAM-dependent methyltransferase [Chloroflexia bacterium]|nr:class I SAM-dependent methyltransferase [Chloroflexia bacterium]
MQYDIIAEKTFDHYQSVSLKDKIYLKARYKLCPYFKILDDLIPNSGTIVDWGCGFGFFSLYMKISQFKRQITGVEIDKRKIKVITQVTKEYSDFSIKHIDEVDIEHNTVDVVLLMEVSYYLTCQSYSKLLEFFNKILKENGLLVVLNTYKKKITGNIILQ